MAKLSFLLVFILSTVFSSAQIDKANLEILHRKLKSVKYADLGITENGMKIIISRGANESSDIIAIRQFVNEDLKLMGAFITPEDKEIGYLNCNSISEIVNISWSVGIFNSELGAIGNYPFTIVFGFADNTQYSFSFPINVSGLTMSMPKAILRGLKKNIGEINPNLSPLKIELPKGELVFTENELTEYFKNSDSKLALEGYYKLIKGEASIDKLAIAQKNGRLYILNIENKYFINDWKYGEMRGTLEPTLGKSIFTGKYYLIDKSVNDIVLTVKEENVIEIARTSRFDSLIFIKIK